MMKKALFHLTVFIAFFTSHSLHAQELEVYYGALGVGAYSVSYTETRPTGKIDITNSVRPAGFIKAGADAQFWGVELRLGLAGNGSKSFPAGTIGSATPFSIDVQASPFFSYLGKVQYPFNDELKAYILLGGTMANFSITPAGNPVLFSTSAIKTGFTYGIGAAYKPSPDFSVDIEWIQYWTGVAMVVSAAGSSKASFGGFGMSVSKSFDF